MTEKETQIKTSPEASDETKNTESKEELTIPKTRFDEVNTAKKELEAKLKALEAEKAEKEKTELEQKEQFKELAEKLKAENESLRLEGLKRDLIQEAIISKELHPKLSRMVNGKTEEEIKQSLDEAKAYHREIQDSFTKDHTADDNTGTGKPVKKDVLSQEEFMKLMEEDPKEADRYLKEVTNA